MSWIHLDDLVRLILFALEHEAISGPLNGTAPAPVTNREFSRMLGAALGRPAILPVPRRALHLLFGEMAAILTASQRVQPEAASRHGFKFRYPSLAPALVAALGQSPGDKGNKGAAVAG
jgi:NAD dependent epimerase/dehydratase family enzyme